MNENQSDGWMLLCFRALPTSEFFYGGGKRKVKILW